MEHPFGQQRTASADDSSNTLFQQRQVLFEDARVYCEEIDALFGLFLDGLKNHFGIEVFDTSADDGLIDWDGAERNWAVCEQLPAYLVEVSSGAQVHNSVGARVEGDLHLLQFFIDRRAYGACTDICIDLCSQDSAYADGFEVGLEVKYVGGDDDSACGDFVAYKLRVEAFTLCDESALVGYPAVFSELKLSCHFLSSVKIKIASAGSDM